jgi:hypothetical protein
VSAPVVLDDVIPRATELVAEQHFDLYVKDEAGNLRKVHGQDCGLVLSRSWVYATIRADPSFPARG